MVGGWWLVVGSEGERRQQRWRMTILIAVTQWGGWRKEWGAVVKGRTLLPIIEAAGLPGDLQPITASNAWYANYTPPDPVSAP